MSRGAEGRTGGKRGGVHSGMGWREGGGKEMKKRKHLHLDSNNFVVMGWCMVCCQDSLQPFDM